MKRVKLRVSGNFLESTWKEWPKIWYPDASWLPSILIRFWLLSVDIPKFGGQFWFSKMGQIWGFQTFFLRTYLKNSMKLKFGMLRSWYSADIWNWLNFGHSLLILPISVEFWLSKPGQIWGFGAFFRTHLKNDQFLHNFVENIFCREYMEGLASNLTCWCICIQILFFFF